MMVVMRQNQYDSLYWWFHIYPEVSVLLTVDAHFLHAYLIGWPQKDMQSPVVLWSDLYKTVIETDENQLR